MACWGSASAAPSSPTARPAAAGNTSEFSPALLLAATPAEGFVQALYRDELGRAGSASELDVWVVALNAPGGSQAAVAAGIENSPEARDHLVKSWYVTFLG